MPLNDKIRKIEELTEELNSLLPMDNTQQEKLDEKIRLEFHYNTNHIEGNTLTYGETKLLLKFDDIVDKHKAREIEEMKASDLAYKYVQELAKDEERPLTENFIKELNETLLVRPYYKEAITEDKQETRRKITIGEYKQYPNSVLLPNGEKFHYASPTETPAMMKDLLDWYHTEKENTELHPIVIAAMLHYKFVRIHPFDDGNGRVSRLLMNYVLLKNNLPPVIIKSEDKPNYLRALNRADAGDEPAFIEYIAEQAIWSLELSIKAAKGEDIEEQSDWKKKLAVLDKKLSNKKHINFIKSSEIVNGLIDLHLNKFLMEVMEGIKIFDKYFLSKDITIGIDKEYFPVESLQKLNNVRDVKEWYGLLITYKKFKKNDTNVFDIQLFITLNFSEYIYSLSLPEVPTVIFNKMYDEAITLQDKEIAIDIIGKYITDLIDKNIKP